MRNPSKSLGTSSAGPGPDRSQYRLETVARACDVLRAFPDAEETLRLKEIVKRTGLHKTIAYRLVHTLRECGLLERSGSGEYRSRVRLLDRRSFRIGYAAQAEDSAFSAAVTEGLRLAASRAGIELVVLDNRYSPTVALDNARRLVAERVDLAIEFQTYEKAAPAIAALFQEAGIPTIAVEIPHPGATFYGADNYRVGLAAGRHLGRWARQHWQGNAEQVLLLELAASGSLPQLRLTGAEAGIHELLPQLQPAQFVHLDVRGEMERSFDLVRKHLRRPPARKTLIAGVNDPAVLGAIRAFEEAGRAPDCAAVGLGAFPEARTELRRTGSRLLATIAFFPERYGGDIIQLASDILRRRHVPPAVYARYEVVTSANVDKIYPADSGSGLGSPH